MQPAVADSVLQSLQNLQKAVLHSAAKQEANGLSHELSKLSSCIHELLQRHAVLEQSAGDRGIAEKALRNVLANKEAESARLRSEISRLRHTLLANQTAAAVADSAEQQPPGDEATAAAVVGPAARQALLDAAVTAKEKPTAAVVRLDSEVFACHSRIADLETELAATAAENSSRLAEQQKAFLAKLERLRQVHGQQIAAAVAETQGQLKQQQTCCQELQQQLLAARQSCEQQQDEITSLQQKLQQLAIAQQSTPSASNSNIKSSMNVGDKPSEDFITSSSTSSSSQQHKSTAPTVEPPPPAAAAAAAAADNLAAQHINSMSASLRSTSAAVAATANDSKQPIDGAPPPNAAAPAAEASTLQLMEGQLARLSGIIRSHQEEIAQLRQALMAGCTERQQLQQQLRHALGAQPQQQQQQQQQQPLGSGGGVPTVVGSAGSSSGVSRRKGAAVASKAVKGALGGMLAGSTQKAMR